MAVRPRSVAASMRSLSFWYLVNQRSLFLNLIDLIRWTMRRTNPPARRPANDRFKRMGIPGRANRDGSSPPISAVRHRCREGQLWVGPDICDHTAAVRLTLAETPRVKPGHDA